LPSCIILNYWQFSHGNIFCPIFSIWILRCYAKKNAIHKEFNVFWSIYLIFLNSFFLFGIKQPIKRIKVFLSLGKRYLTSHALKVPILGCKRCFSSYNQFFFFAELEFSNKSCSGTACPKCWRVSKTDSTPICIYRRQTKLEG